GAGLPSILQDTSGTTYEYGQGLTLSDASGALTYYDADGLGSTVLTTGAAGNAINTYDYDVYGGPRVAPPNFGFTGQQPDASGLIYLRARSLDPIDGLFTGRDSHVAATQQAYAYA